MISDKFDVNPRYLGRWERVFWLSLASAIFGADFVSKILIGNWLDNKEGLYKVTLFLNLRSVENTGAAFGLLADSGTWGALLLALVSIVFTVGIAIYIAWYKQLDIWLAFAAALMLGGAAGNGYDRIVHGKVYDFVDVHLFGWHWPAFNLADASISLSVILFIWYYWISPARRAN